MANFERLILELKRGETTVAQFLDLIKPTLGSAGVDRDRLLSDLNAAKVWPSLDEADRRLLFESVTSLPEPGSSPASLGAVEPDATVTLLLDTPPATDGNGRWRRPAATDMEFAPVRSAQDPADANAPVVLKDRFRLVEQIGSGGTSDIYRAVDMRKLEAQARNPFVAIKLLKLRTSTEHESLVLLQREVQKSQSLLHPNIVQVFDFDRDDSRVFMTMEYLEGASLKALLAKDPGFGADQDHALRIVRAIGDALSYAHRHLIVHGDLKPGNVLITKEDQVKVIDFGIARAFADPAAPHPPAGAGVTGPDGYTPAYASPEKSESREPHPAHDVYALACVTYEILAGRHPFAKFSGAAARDFKMVVERDPRLTNRQFEAIAHALRFDMAERTQSIDEFLDELTRAPQLRRLALAAGALLLVLAFAALVWNYSRNVAEPGPVVATAAGVPPPGTRLQDCAVCPPMMVVGGAATGEAGAAAVDGADLAIGVGEVTVGEFGAFVSARSYAPEPGCAEYDGEWRFNRQRNWQDPGFRQTSSHPVTCVSWQDAVAYAEWLSETTGKSYRLPTADEWSAAAARGADEPLCGASNVADRSAERQYPGWQVAECRDGYVFTAPTATFRPNARGLHDTAGNVFEWVADCVGEDCRLRQLKGGSWFSQLSFAAPESLNHFPATTRSTSIGLRVARELSP
ncbi:MAG: bifunctional serine/threonine-protein kinase/formylglycine-generating enzyme family protein [Steroidobacteraceae bacterium]